MLTEPLEIPALTPDVRPQITRARALIEVLVCSGYTTQLTIVALLSVVGIMPGADGSLSPTFIFAVSIIDTVVLLSLVVLLLKRSGDRPRDIFLGERRVLGELGFGVAMVPAIFIVVLATQLGLRAVAPYLHNVEVSPFTPLLSSPALLIGFVVLVLVAGGIREELQRAFLLHRFEQRLGGGWVGVVITSVAFGLGHTLQGWDAAIVTAMMGAFWGVIYLNRRSVAGTVTNHALFNVAQVLVAYATLTRA